MRYKVNNAPTGVRENEVSVKLWEATTRYAYTLICTDSVECMENPCSTSWNFSKSIIE